MRELAPGLHQLSGHPRDAINVYLAGDVLIDAGTRHARRRIMRQIAGHSVTAHALTHAHPDHQGASHAVCTALGIPLWCGEGDADAMETPGGIARKQEPGLMNRLQQRFWTGPPHPSHAGCARVTTSPGSRCSRCRVTPRVTSRSGASTTAP